MKVRPSRPDSYARAPIADRVLEKVTPRHPVAKRCTAADYESAGKASTAYRSVTFRRRIKDSTFQFVRRVHMRPSAWLSAWLSSGGVILARFESGGGGVRRPWLVARRCTTCAIT